MFVIFFAGALTGMALGVVTMSFLAINKNECDSFKNIKDQVN